MFLAVLFIIAKIMEATKCTSTDEWLRNKDVNIYTVKYDSAVKKKE